MKKILLYALALVYSISLNAQNNTGVDFQHISLDEAISMIAKNTNGPKLVFVDCYTSWCVPCKKMANEEFVKEEAGQYFNTNFINIKMDMEKGDGPAIRKKYGVSIYPTFLLIDGAGKEVSRVVGASSISEFIDKIKFAADPGNSPDSLKLAYIKDPNLNTAIKYINSLERLRRTKDIVEFMSEAYPKFTPLERFENKLQKEVFMCLTNPDSKLIGYCLDNKGEFDRIFGKTKINEILIRTFSLNLIKYVGGDTNISKESAKEQVRYLQLLSTKNFYNDFICRIALFYANDNITGIESQIKVNNVMQSFTPTEQFTIKRMLFSVPGIDKQKIVDFYNGELEYHEKQIKYSKEALQKIQ